MLSPVVKEMAFKEFYLQYTGWACPSPKEGCKPIQAFVLLLRNNYNFGRASNHRAQDKGSS